MGGGAPIGGTLSISPDERPPVVIPPVQPLSKQPNNGHAAPAAAGPHAARPCQVLVVGAGHAGCEAALAAARMGCRTLAPQRQSRHRRADALQTPRSVDPPRAISYARSMRSAARWAATPTGTFIQIRELNTSKGPAVRALRAQSDKRGYGAAMRRVLELQPNLTLVQGEVEGLIWMPVTERGERRWCVRGVRTRDGRRWAADTVVVTTGTFLKGRLVRGESISPGGRARRAARHRSGGRPARRRVCDGPAENRNPAATGRPHHRLRSDRDPARILGASLLQLRAAPRRRGPKGSPRSRLPIRTTARLAYSDAVLLGTHHHGHARVDPDQSASGAHVQRHDHYQGSSLLSLDRGQDRALRRQAIPHSLSGAGGLHQPRGLRPGRQHPAFPPMSRSA